MPTEDKNKAKGSHLPKLPPPGAAPDFASPESVARAIAPHELSIRFVEGEVSVSEESQPRLREFLSLFPESIFCYLEDAEGRPKDLPPFHDSVLDFNKSKQGYGMFISVNGFKSTKSRAGDNLSALQHLYVDIDAPKEVISEKGLKDFKNKTLKDIHQLDGICPLSILIETKRGFHAYWRISPVIRSVAEPETRDVYLALLADIRSRLGGDDGAKDLARVLRVPFTLHQKDPKDPFLVKILAMRPDQAMSLWEYKAILLKEEAAIVSILETAGALPAIDPKNRPDAASPVPPEEEPLVFQLAGVRDEVIPENVKRLAFEEAKAEVQRQYPKHERPSFLTLSNPNAIGPGERNISLLIAASILREGGAYESDVVARFPSYNGLSPREISSVIRHAFNRSVPYEFGWNNSIYQRAITEEERTKVRQLTSAFMSRKLASYVAAKRVAKERNETSEKIEQAAVEALKQKTTLASGMSKTEQQENFDILESLFIKDHPTLRAVGGSYFIERGEDGLWHLVSTDMMYGRVSNFMWSLGILRLRSNSNISSKVKSLLHFPAIQVSPDLVNSARLAQKRLNSPGPFVPVKNGLLDVETLTLHPYEDDTIFLSPIQASWVPKIDLPETDLKLVEGFLSSVAEGKEDKIKLLKTVMGYTLLSDCRFQKSFILFGAGANGKSTFMEMLVGMLGIENTLPFRLEKLSQNFFTHSILGKRLGVVEEVSNSYFESDVFKKLVSGEPIEADRKYQSPVTFTPFMKILLAVNELPKVNDTTKGFYRRVTIVPFDASFDGMTADRDLGNKLEAARNAVLSVAIEGLRYLLKNGGFPTTQESEDQMNAYKIQNATTLSFLQELYLPVPRDPSSAYELSAMSNHTLYAVYQNYCREAGFRPKAIPSFTNELRGLRHPNWPDLEIRTVQGRQFVLGAKPRNPLIPLSSQY